MTFWSEIRPPNREGSGHPRGSRWSTSAFRRAIRYVPLGLALIAAAAGLVAVANQQSASPEPLIVESVALPTATSPGLIDLNTATVAELATLPGIGETRARAIIASRGKVPFRSLTDLADRGILRPSQLPAIAKQAAVYASFD